MKKTRVKGFETLQEELITSSKLEQMANITSLVDRLYAGEIKYEVVLPEINNLPRYNTSDENGVILKYEESIYKLALYAVFTKRYKLLRNPEIYRIANELLGEEVEQFNVYANGVPEKLKEAINNTRLNASRKGYINRNLMWRLFAYKYGSQFPDFSSEYRYKVSFRDYGISKVNRVKKEIKMLGAKAALWTMISIPAYIAPSVIIKGLSNRIYTKKEYAAEVVIDDDKTIRGEYSTLPFQDSFPDDYKDKKLQYITEYGETKDDRVVIKVYDYTGIDVSKENLDTMDLDINRLVHCNVEKVYSYGTKSFLFNKYLGNYTGKAHRNISTLEEHLYVTKDGEKAKVFNILVSLFVYTILILSDYCLLTDKKKYLLFGRVYHLLQKLKESITEKKSEKVAIERLQKEIDEIKEFVYIITASKDLDKYIEEYVNLDEEEGSFRKALRL